MSGGDPGRRRPARSLLSAAASCALATTLVTGCGLTDEQDPPASSTPITPSPTTPLSVTQSVLVHDVGGKPVQAGRADVQVSVVALDDGTIGPASGPDGSAGFGFPSYRPTGTYPRAVLVVSNTGANDDLDPGARAFTWGTDFRVDNRSEGRTEDNGDNLIQRGLYSEPTLYKAELDLDRPACVVRGDQGTVTIRGDAIVPGLWYHMECRRDGLQVTVTSWLLSAPDDRASRTATGSTGDVTPSEPDVPLSIGGKVAQNGAIIESATDQMNGDLANPFLAIDGR